MLSLDCFTDKYLNVCSSYGNANTSYKDMLDKINVIIVKVRALDIINSLKVLTCKLVGFFS